MRLLIALFFATTGIVAAQGPQVPHKMQFADLTLTIRDDARTEIQKDVDAYTRYPKSFNVKAERARTYFPLIEGIFAEEGVPDDLKYLVIQESALIADAVSVSNAVGFWQFKDFTALEMGLRVDKEVDERQNIISSTRAAARYLKKNNTFFNNWLYALQAYQMGAGGVMRSVKDSKSGVKHMDITSETYWYVKKYLAHKIAYEGVVKGPAEVRVLTYQTQKKQSLSDIAKEVVVDEEELKSYNKWTKSGMVPDDRPYAVMIPVKGNTSVKIPEYASNLPAVHSQDKKTLVITKKEDRKKINGIPAIRGYASETPTLLATRAGVELSSFLKWNDLSISDRIKEGQFYLLGKKRKRGSEAYHTAVAGDDLWTVSQQYGVAMKRLKKYNRINSDADIKAGATLYLASMKPKESEKVVSDKQVVEVANNDTFAWGINTAESAPVVSIKPVPAATPEPEVTIVDKADKQPDIAPDSIQNLQPATPEKTVVESTASLPETLEVTAKKGEHLVVQGETLYGIARQYGIGVMDLVNWNGLNLQQGIKPGQILKLSDPQAIETAMVTTAPASSAPAITTYLEHEVKASDTVYSIARKYGVTIKELLEWNNKKDFNLSIGEKLKIQRSN